MHNHFERCNSGHLNLCKQDILLVFTDEQSSETSTIRGPLYLINRPESHKTLVTISSSIFIISPLHNLLPSAIEESVKVAILLHFLVFFVRVASSAFDWLINDRFISNMLISNFNDLDNIRIRSIFKIYNSSLILVNILS